MSELKHAIEDAYNVGIIEPTEIAEYIIANHSKQWLGKALAAEARHIVSQYATRHAINQRRLPTLTELQDKGYQRADTLADEPKFFAPEIGWKLAADCSADDLLVIAAWSREKARPFLVAADAFESVAAEMRELRVERLGEFPAGLRVLAEAA